METAFSKEQRQVFKSKYNTDVVNIEDAVSLLKSEGLSQLESVRFLCLELKMPLREADYAVLYSKAWENMRQANIAFRNDFFDELEKLEEEEKQQTK